MLFYVQMKWNYQGRISQQELWAREAEEGQHGLEGLRSGMVKGLYKVVSQHRVIAIVDVPSLEDLDRNSMFGLPMREFLEFEQVWALRDYAGFIQDVQEHAPRPASADEK
jgi:muconolactone delta-isomerase